MSFSNFIDDNDEVNSSQTDHLTYSQHATPPISWSIPSIPPPTAILHFSSLQNCGGDDDIDDDNNENNDDDYGNNRDGDDDNNDDEYYDDKSVDNDDNCDNNDANKENDAHTVPFIFPIELRHPGGPHNNSIIDHLENIWI